MTVKHLTKLSALAALAVAATAYAAPACFRDDLADRPMDEQRLIVKLERSCEPAQAKTQDQKKDDEESVSWLDWAFDSRRSPSFHFIDLLELLGIG